MKTQETNSILTRRVNKWKPTGLCDGLDNEQAKNLVAVLEHTAQGFLKKFDDSKKIARNVDVIFPIVRVMYDKIKFESVPLSTYLDEKEHARTVHEYKTNVELDLGAEPTEQEIDRACETLTKFFEDKMGGECYVNAYAFVLKDTEDPDVKEICFRGNFLER